MPVPTCDRTSQPTGVNAAANIGVDTAGKLFDDAQARDFRTYPTNCLFVAVRQTFGLGQWTNPLPRESVDAIGCA